MTDRARGARTLVESGVRQSAALVRVTAARLLDRSYYDMQLPTPFEKIYDLLQIVTP